MLTHVKGISGDGISRGETEADPSTKEEVRLPHSPLPSTLGKAALPSAEEIFVHFCSLPRTRSTGRLLFHYSEKNLAV